MKLIWEIIKQIIKETFCHHKWEFVTEIHGDIRNWVHGRYEYRCSKCHKSKFTDVINTHVVS